MVGDVHAPLQEGQGWEDAVPETAKCELEVVPFGEPVMYRMPEVANDRHQGLEERWVDGIWLGHARHPPDILKATDEGMVRTWAIRGMPERQQWDGDRRKRIRGSLHKLAAGRQRGTPNGG
ncbi:hypothetical protein N9L68_06015 [bacterium]|nr:hypothetical protein [bacterium]